MGRFLVRILGHKAAHKVVRKHTQDGGFLDVKYGYRLLKDPSVPAAAKLSALALGIALTTILLAMEAPIELILGLFLPVIGAGTDFFIDGLEIVLFPLLVACLVLPRIVRQPTVAPAFAAQPVSAPPYLGEKIDMPPPMLDVIG